ncbi:MAG TPA: 3-dehydroquinate synthase [Longimicrobiales bacterium]
MVPNRMNNIIIDPGALDQIAKHVPRAHAYAIISDTNVSKLYAERVIKQLPNAQLFEFPAGEANKNRETWAAISDLMIARGLGRDCCVIALGGGVTGDMAGFVAATYMRGVPVVQVPTTLLAMIDASIGGKTGVDTPGGKNLIGAFHQPELVLIDPNVLRTLPDAELSAGLSEAIKHGAIADAQYMQWITESIAAVFERRTHTLESLIRRSVEIKLDHVSDDPREQGKRAALNFGHTIGHALERVCNYAISHGEAVAFGMITEAYIGLTMGVTEHQAPDQLEEALVRTRTLPEPVSMPDVEDLLQATRADKKARRGAVRYTLLRDIGEVARSEAGEWTVEVPDDVVRKALVLPRSV